MSIKTRYVRATKKGHIVSFTDTTKEIFISSTVSGIDPRQDLGSHFDRNYQTVAAYLQSLAHTGAGRVYRKAS